MRLIYLGFNVFQLSTVKVLSILLLILVYSWCFIFRKEALLMSNKNNSVIDARQELAELVKRKAEIGVTFFMLYSKLKYL